MKNCAGTIKRVNDGLKTRFDATNLKFKKTFTEAKKLGVDLNNTNVFFKRDGYVWHVIVTAFKYECDGRYRESVNVHRFLKLNS